MVTDRDMKMMISLLVAGIMAASVPACAQRISMSTDLLGYACLGTLNADVSYSMSKRWSIGVGVRYNPFTFNIGDPQNQLQQFSEGYLVRQMVAGQILQKRQFFSESKDLYRLEGSYVCSEIIGKERREEIGVRNGKGN